MHEVADSIERVLNPSASPARRFRSLIDTVFTLALGSVCAFALTFGPAPLNTLAASADPGLPFAELGQTMASDAALPAEVKSPSDNARTQKEAAEQRISQRSTSPSTTSQGAEAQQNPASQMADPDIQSPLAGDTTVPAPQVLPPGQVLDPLPAVVPNPGAVNAAADVLAMVENHRTASGLHPFLDAGSCDSPALQLTVHVTPSTVLPPGLAELSLVPDPALASAEDSGYGPVSVAIYLCS